MDITDINKVASRKRMNTDAEKLREKVSRETAKIIKLKVAQDTAYWDLKEKLQQVEGAHERLQQNMVEVQMQHEAISSHYQHELRLRPDTLNKAAGSRDMCDVLEEYGERLRRGVARCRQDGAALSAAYRHCGARARALRQRARRAAAGREAGARRERAALERLGAAAAERRELVARLDRAAEDAQRKEEAAVALRTDISRSLRELEEQNAELKRTIYRLEKEAQEAAGLGAALADSQRALAVQGERARDAAQHAQQLQDALASATSANEDIKKLLSNRTEDIKNLENVINDKNQRESDLETELNSMKQYIHKLEADKLTVEKELVKMTQEGASKSATISEMSRASLEASESLAAARNELSAARRAQAAALDELRAALAARERELRASGDTIARLMADLKAESDARARADAGLAARSRRADAELDAARARERALADTAARQDAALKDKDAELSAQVALIMDGRAEKERLQQKIQGMQNTIDNIQKELTGRLAGVSAAAAEAPEQDAPRRPDDASLYNFLSDGSVDGDALDPREVGRRFQALQRGAASRCSELQGSISLSQMKDDLKMKSKTFFKNKRYDNKIKKLK